MRLFYSMQCWEVMCRAGPLDEKANCATKYPHDVVKRCNYTLQDNLKRTMSHSHAFILLDSTDVPRRYFLGHLLITTVQCVPVFCCIHPFRIHKLKWASMGWGWVGVRYCVVVWVSMRMQVHLYREDAAKTIDHGSYCIVKYTAPFWDLFLYTKYFVQTHVNTMSLKLHDRPL